MMAVVRVAPVLGRHRAKQRSSCSCPLRIRPSRCPLASSVTDSVRTASNLIAWRVHAASAV